MEFRGGRDSHSTVEGMEMPPTDADRGCTPLPIHGAPRQVHWCAAGSRSRNPRVCSHSSSGRSSPNTRAWRRQGLLTHHTPFPCGTAARTSSQAHREQTFYIQHKAGLSFKVNNGYSLWSQKSYSPPAPTNVYLPILGTGDYVKLHDGGSEGC